MTVSHQSIEAPFNYRHCCWFCGEPAASNFSFPQIDNYVIDCCHPALSVPCCKECLKPALLSQASSIWLVTSDVKRFLINKYQKDLAIGINWTQQELENSGFETGNFAGFQKSAWLMFEIAKTRVNFRGWPLVVAGINIEHLRWQATNSFIFDGVAFPSVDDAISHYARVFSLHQSFFKQVLHLLGVDKFSQAVRFCRLLIGSTPDERQHALQSLKHTD